MNLTKAEKIITKKYVHDIKGNSILPGDIIVVATDNHVSIETVKKIFPDSDLLTTIYGDRYIASYTLNISKMYDKEELKEKENKVNEILNNELIEKEKLKQAKALEKWVFGINFKNIDEYGICYFKISNSNKVTNNDVIIEISNYLKKHENEKIFILNNDYEFEEFNENLKNIKLFNFDSVLFGNNNDKFQYIRRMIADEYNTLSDNTRAFNKNINKLFTKKVCSDGSIVEWIFPYKHTGWTKEKLEKVINSYLKLINNNI